MKELYVFFSANYFPHIGGVERYTYGLTRALLKCGKHVAIVTSSMKNEPRYSVDSDGAMIYRVASAYVLGDRMPLMLPGTAWRRLKNVFGDYDQVRVIIQTMLYPMSLWALHFAKKNKYPFIVISHGANYVCLGHRVVDWMEHKYEKFMLRQAKRKCATFFSVSKSGGDWLSTFQISPCGVLYNSVDHFAIEDIYTSAPEGIRSKLKIPEKAVVFSFVGRLIAEKGVFQLINAFSKLRSEGWKISLFVIGDGPEMKTLKKKKKDQIVYFGYKSNLEVLHILKESDCLCLPSDSEGGLPTVILEAILCRNYIITSPYGGAMEVITSNKYGYVMTGNSENNIYDAMKFFLEHREMCSQTADLCRQHFYEDGYTWENTCSRLMSYFDNTPPNS